MRADHVGGPGGGVPGRAAPAAPRRPGRDGAARRAARARPDGRGPDAAAVAVERGVHHLHVGLDGPAEGGARRAPAGAQLPGGVGGAVPGRGGPRPAALAALLRPDRDRPVRAAAERRLCAPRGPGGAARAGAGRRGARGPAAGDVPEGDAQSPAADHRPARGVRAGRGAGPRWRVADRPRGAGAARRAPGGPGPQRVRPDRDDRRLHHVAGRDAGRPRGRRADHRPPVPEHPDAGPRPVPAARAGRGAGRAVRVRGAAGARLSEPSRAERVPVRRRPLRGAGRADVPHR